MLACSLNPKVVEVAHVFGRIVTASIGLDFVEVVLVQLTDEGGEIGVLKVLRQDSLRELIHVLWRRGNSFQNRANRRV